MFYLSVQHKTSPRDKLESFVLGVEEHRTKISCHQHLSHWNQGIIKPALLLWQSQTGPHGPRQWMIICHVCSLWGDKAWSQQVRDVGQCVYFRLMSLNTHMLTTNLDWCHSCSSERAAKWPYGGIDEKQDMDAYVGQTLSCKTRTGVYGFVCLYLPQILLAVCLSVWQLEDMNSFFKVSCNIKPWLCGV